MAREIPQLIGLPAVAEALDMDERTVRRKIGSRGRDRLVAAKIGGRWKVRLTDLEDYIDAHTVR
jgi:hypothetical protein